MKILFVAPLASIHAQRWISFFTSKGHEIQIIDSQNTGLKEFAGARVHGIPWSSSSHHSYTIKLLSSAVKLPSFLKAFRRVLNNFKPHVVHLHWITGPHAYALATTISDSSLIATPMGQRHSYPAQRKLASSLYRPKSHPEGNQILLRRATSLYGLTELWSPQGCH